MADGEYQWVRQNYQNIKDAKDDNIISVDARGLYRYETMMFTESNGEERSRKGLLLRNQDIPFKKSSAAKITAQQGWKVVLVVQSDNNDYWNDNTDLPYWQDDANFARQDNIYVTLNGNMNDYMSVDIDEDFVGIKNLRIYSEGVLRSDKSTDNMNNEARFWIDEIYKWEFVEFAPTPPGGDEVNDPDIDSDGDGLPNDVDGDDDNDGVPDGIDPEPFDPTITVVVEEEEEDETQWGKVLGFVVVLGVVGLLVARFLRPGGEE